MFFKCCVSTLSLEHVESLKHLGLRRQVVSPLLDQCENLAAHFGRRVVRVLDKRGEKGFKDFSKNNFKIGGRKKGKKERNPGTRTERKITRALIGLSFCKKNTPWETPS